MPDSPLPYGVRRAGNVDPCSTGCWCHTRGTKPTLQPVCHAHWIPLEVVRTQFKYSSILVLGFGMGSDSLWGLPVKLTGFLLQ